MPHLDQSADRREHRTRVGHRSSVDRAAGLIVRVRVPRPSTLRSSSSSARRLDATSWIDVAPGWLHGHEAVFDQLWHELPWRQRTVTMYERRVAEPRLTWWWAVDGGTAEPLAVLADARHAARRPLRRDVRLHRVQLLPPRRRLRGVARRPSSPHRHRPRRGDRQRRPAPTAAPAARGRRPGAVVRPRPRRPVRHGWRLPTRLGALRPEGPLGRSAHLDHVPVRRRPPPHRRPRPELPGPTHPRVSGAPPGPETLG